MTAILGGGIAGLSAAYYSLENPKLGSIVLYEASNRLGGWIKSIKTSNGIFEKGPRTIRIAGGTNTLELVDKLNLDNQVVAIDNKHPASSQRLIYVNKELHLLPKSMFKVYKPFNRRLISVLWNDFRTPKVPKEDDSIYTFVERRLGKDVADYLISPMICGIYAGNAKEISVNSLMRKLFQYEQVYGSISKGFLMDQVLNLFSKEQKSKNSNSNTVDLVDKATKEHWNVWGLKNGLEQLPLALSNNLKSNENIKITTETKCEQITFKSDEVELLVNGKVENYGRVISTLGAKNLAPLLQRQHPQLARELEAIPFVNVAVVNLCYPGKVLPMDAFGFLVPPDENLPILGIIFDSCLFKNDSNTVLTVMMGGAFFNKYFADNVTKEKLLSIAVSQSKSILNIKDDPIEHDVALLKDCIPQYVVGHDQRLQRINNYISAHKIPLTLCGSSYQGVGLNDVILSAKQAVSHLTL